jgi:hypothetical protein
VTTGGELMRIDWVAESMRVSLDLDDTLICYGGVVECEPRLAWWARLVVRDEPVAERDQHCESNQNFATGTGILIGNLTTPVAPDQNF